MQMSLLIYSLCDLLLLLCIGLGCGRERERERDICLPTWHKLANPFEMEGVNMTVLDVCLCLQTLSDAIISFSFKLACCSFQRGVSEDRTEGRAVFLPAVAARLSVTSRSRPRGTRVGKERNDPASSPSHLAVCFVWKLPIHVRRVKAPQVPCTRAALGISGAETPEKKNPEREKHAAEETASAPALGRYGTSSFTPHIHYSALFSR